MQRPIVAVLVTEKDMSRIRRRQHYSGADLRAAAARQAGVGMFYCSLRSLDPIRRRARGLVQSSDGSWAMSTVPWPDVLYERCRSPYGRARGKRRRIRRLTIPINAVTSISKWQFYAALRRSAKVAQRLPATTLLASLQVFREMLKRWSAVIIKPDWGAQGLGLIRLRLLPDGSCLWYESTDAKAEARITFDTASKRVADLVKQRRYVIQQQLNLMTVRGQACDFRLHMMKNRTGRWVCSNSYARLAPGDDFVTSNFRGARLLSRQEALRSAFGPTQATEIEQQMRAVALRSMRRLERRIGRMGEIGLDLGVGTDGAVWLIEANATPELPPAQSLVAGAPITRYLPVFEYAKYLYARHHSS